MTNIGNFIRGASHEQVLLLERIAQQAEKEKELVDEIEDIYGSIKTGIYYPVGMSPIICADEDDAKVISMGPRTKLDEVRLVMKHYLKESVRLEMTHLGIIQRTYKTYVGEDLPSTLQR